MSNPKESLKPGGCYHIFNHAVGDDKLFVEERNYPFFLQKVDKWILPCSNLLAYCLMPNHYHFLVRIKEEGELAILWEEKLNHRISLWNVQNPEDVLNPTVVRRSLIEKLIVEQFSHCFNSYVQAYNKVYSRIGALMKEGFQRKLIDTDDYLIRVICYIHNNPVNHGFVAQPGEWRYSSFNAIFKNTTTRISRDEALKVLGGLENAVFLHRKFLGSEF